MKLLRVQWEKSKIQKLFIYLNVSLLNGFLLINDKIE